MVKSFKLIFQINVIHIQCICNGVQFLANKIFFVNPTVECSFMSLLKASDFLIYIFYPLTNDMYNCISTIVFWTQIYITFRKHDKQK